MENCPKCGLSIDHFIPIYQLNAFLNNDDWRNGVESEDNLYALEKIGDLISEKVEKRRHLKKKLSKKEKTELSNVFLEEVMECLKGVEHTIIFFSVNGEGPPNIEEGKEEEELPTWHKRIGDALEKDKELHAWLLGYMIGVIPEEEIIRHLDGAKKH